MGFSRDDRSNLSKVSEQQRRFGASVEYDPGNKMLTAYLTPIG